MYIIILMVALESVTFMCFLPKYWKNFRQYSTRYCVTMARNIENCKGMRYNAVYGGDKYEKSQCIDCNGVC